MDTNSLNRTQSGLGITGMILGIIAVLSSCVIFGGMLGLAATIFSAFGLAQKNRNHGTAIAGLILGLVAIAVVVGNYSGRALLNSIIESNNDTEAMVSSISESNNSKKEDGFKKTDITEFEIEKSEIYNKEGIKIICTGNQSDTDIKIGFEFDNNSDKDAGVIVHAFCVNEVFVDEGDYVKASSGNKIKFEIKIQNKEIEKYGINTIKKVNVIFDIISYSENTLWRNNVISCDLRTNMDDGLYNQLFGEKIYSDKNIDVIYLGNTGSMYEFAVYSKFEKFIDYTIRDCAINEYMYSFSGSKSDYFEKPLFPRTYSKFTLDIKDDFLKENDMSVVEEIEFKFTGDYDITTMMISDDPEVEIGKIVLKLE